PAPQSAACHPWLGRPSAARAPRSSPSPSACRRRLSFGRSAAGPCLSVAQERGTSPRSSAHRLSRLHLHPEDALSLLPAIEVLDLWVALPVALAVGLAGEPHGLPLLVGIAR